MSLKLFDKLSQDFSEILNDETYHDVIIEVGKEQDKKLFNTHSAILYYRSSYFRTELSKIPKDSKKTILLPDVTSQVFEVIIKYIYGGIVILENVDDAFIFDLMISADGIKLEELSKQLESYLLKNKTPWLRTNIFFIYHSIFKSNNFKDLESFCNAIIVKCPNLIFDSENFNSLHESALISLIKQDDLQLEEIIIWEKIIYWGIYKNSTLPLKLEEWSNEDFSTLKTTLQHCLPHIRYFQFSAEELLKRVKPYKKILDKNLWSDLKQHLMLPGEPVNSTILPPRKARELSDQDINTPSTIITKEHIAEISSWIDRKETTYLEGKIPYEFQLILRGSRDGFAPQTFWDMCHGHSNTVVIIKVAETNEILGGYNPMEWIKTVTTDGIYISGTWMETKDSFIFSLKNGSIRNSILSRVIDPKRAIYYCNTKYQRTHGIYFGNALYMRTEVNDFTKYCTNRCDRSNNYERHIREKDGNFSILDYEVFEIIKK